MGIVFVEHNFGFDPIADLYASGVLFQETYELLTAATERGGYIAGGFAVLIGRKRIVECCTCSELDIAVANHLGNDSWRMLSPSAPSWHKKISHADIDVWFPDVASLAAFTHVVRDVKNCTVESTVTNTATEYCVRGKQRVQVVTRYLMPMHEQLSRFDILNSMAGIRGNVLTVPENWCALEASRTLHVEHWKSPWTVSRIMKYMRRKGYTHLTPETAACVVDEAVKACEYVHAHPDVGAAAVGIAMNPFRRARMGGNLPWLLKSMFSSFTDEQLVLLSVLCHTDTYNAAMHEVIKRGNK